MAQEGSGNFENFKCLKSLRILKTLKDLLRELEVGLASQSPKLEEFNFWKELGLNPVWGSGWPGSDFLFFSIRSLLRTDQFGALAGQAQISSFSQLNPYWELTSLGLWLARLRFPFFLN